MSPVDVAGLTSGVSSIDARGLGHSCAVTTGGAVKCWGDNSFGQLGSGTGPSSQPLPVNVQGLTSGIAQVIVGRNHTCAVTTSGGLKCWGYDAEGQLGNDSSFSAQPAPVDVVGLGAPVVSASASSHTCAVLSTGGLKCWGPNAGGRLGDGTVSNQPTPVAVQGLTVGVTGVSAGPSHTCVVTSAGAVKCWEPTALESLEMMPTLSAAPIRLRFTGQPLGSRALVQETPSLVQLLQQAD